MIENFENMNMTEAEEYQEYLEFKQFKNMKKNAGNYLSNPLYGNVCSVIQYPTGETISQCSLTTAQDEAQNTPEGGNEPMAQERTRVYAGKDEYGKPIYKQVSGKDQNERNDRIVAEYVRSGRIFEFLPRDSGVPIQQAEQKHSAKHLFEEYVQSWFETYKKGKCEGTTEHQFECRIRDYNKFFEGKYLEDLNTKYVQDYLNFKGKTHSKSTMIVYGATLKEVLKFARDEEIIKPNAILFDRLKITGKQMKTRRSASEAEYVKICNSIPMLEDEKEKILLSLLCFTAMRTEEVKGLRWEDIDFDKNLISVQRAITFYKGKRSGDVKEPKTPTSKATIPMNKILADVLREYKKESGWLFDDGSNGYWKDHKFTKAWKSIGKKIDLFGLRMCEFRKTVATILIARGADIKCVQRLLRHKKVDTTLNVYAEVEPKTFEKTCQMLG